jgi:uncharacterized protein (DUF924 family)
MMTELHYDDILAFWFSDDMSAHWFKSTTQIDREITTRFEPLWRQAREGHLDSWSRSARGSLALIIILDQFPLNMYRGKADSFSTEANAIRIAREAIQSGFDKELQSQECVFMYLPFMHSESLHDQEYCVELFTALGLQDNIKFALHHHAIVQQFGRFPHRNSILGRDSNQAEIDYMNSDDAFKG